MNRFKPQPNQNHSQTWHILDRTTGEKVMDFMSPDSAKAWARGMNEDYEAGRPVQTMSGEI